MLRGGEFSPCRELLMAKSLFDKAVSELRRTEKQTGAAAENDARRAQVGKLGGG
jgi:hypothetical protein